MATGGYSPLGVWVFLFHRRQRLIFLAACPLRDPPPLLPACPLPIPFSPLTPSQQLSLSCRAILTTSLRACLATTPRQSGPPGPGPARPRLASLVQRVLPALLAHTRATTRGAMVTGSLADLPALRRVRGFRLIVVIDTATPLAIAPPPPRGWSSF